MRVVQTLVEDCDPREGPASWGPLCRRERFSQDTGGSLKLPPQRKKRGASVGTQISVMEIISFPLSCSSLILFKPKACLPKAHVVPTVVTGEKQPTPSHAVPTSHLNLLIALLPSFPLPDRCNKTCSLYKKWNKMRQWMIHCYFWGALHSKEVWWPSAAKWHFCSPG